MLQIKLDAIMMKRNVRNPRQFLICQARINHVMATKILKGEVDLLRLSHLEAMCRELRCTPNEIFEWVPKNNENPLADNHPLHKLSDRKAEAEFFAKLSAMTSDELRAAMNKIE